MAFAAVLTLGWRAVVAAPAASLPMLHITGGSARLSGTWSTGPAPGHTTFHGKLLINKLNATVTQRPPGHQTGKTAPRAAVLVRLTHCNCTVPLAFVLQGGKLKKLTVRPGLFTCHKATAHTLVIADIRVHFLARQGKLMIPKFSADLLKGVLHGSAAYNVATRQWHVAAVLANVSEHNLLRNVKPLQLDAAGRTDLRLALAGGSAGLTGGVLDFDSATPGVLKVARLPWLQRMLKHNYSTKMAAVILAGLRHYRYKAGVVKFQSNGPNTLLNVKFSALPGQKPARPRRIIMGGKPVLVRPQLKNINLHVTLQGASLLYIMNKLSGVSTPAKK